MYPYEDKIEYIKLLVDRGANVDHRNVEGETVLDLAVQQTGLDEPHVKYFVYINSSLETITGLKALQPEDQNSSDFSEDSQDSELSMESDDYEREEKER